MFIVFLVHILNKDIASVFHHETALLTELRFCVSFTRQEWVWKRDRKPASNTTFLRRARLFWSFLRSKCLVWTLFDTLYPLHDSSTVCLTYGSVHSYLKPYFQRSILSLWHTHYVTIRYSSRGLSQQHESLFLLHTFVAVHLTHDSVHRHIRR